jgi:hypothetical protein
MEQPGRSNKILPPMANNTDQCCRRSHDLDDRVLHDLMTRRRLMLQGTNINQRKEMEVKLIFRLKKGNRWPMGIFYT